jgi:hypothetical protein
MRSAFYYPHTEIQSEDVMKTALLLWDEIHVIVPWEQYSPRYHEPLLNEAFEVIGKRHAPTEHEKLLAHSLVEELVNSHKLPPSFFYEATSPRAYRELHGLHQTHYEVYSDKLLHKTWDLLRHSRLAGPVYGMDSPTSPYMGLTLMSILADCCSKRSFTRITDRGAAYASLQSVFADGVEQEAETLKNELVPIVLDTVNPKQLDLKRLIDFRKNEGPSERNLRHRLQNHLENQARIITSAQSQTERNEALRQFKSDTNDDLKLLKEALKFHTLETLGTKEIITTVVTAIGTAALIGLNVALPVSDIATAVGAPVAIGGLIAARSKFVRERKKLLEEHPTSYLYEASGGLRL